MKAFRTALKRQRWLVLLVTAVTTFYSAEGQLWAAVAQIEQAEEERLAELASRLGVSPDRLRRDRAGLLATLRALLGVAEDDPGRARLEARLASMAEEGESNPFRTEIDAVLEGYAHTRAEAVLGVLADLSSIEVARLPREARKALLRTLQADLEEALTLPEKPDLPGRARGRANALRGRLHQLTAKLRPILARPDALSDERLSRTLAEIAAALDGEVRRPPAARAPLDRPLPVEEREREASTEPAPGTTVGQASPALVAGPRSASALTGRAAEIAPEVAALAAELGGSPGRIFAWVHDRIGFDPKWGAVRGPAGTLLEGEGTSWDQAWLLRDLLVASGVDARVEWGEIELPIEVLTNLVGVTDPFRAGDLLTTGGVPIVLRVEGSRVVAARMSHPWVLAHVDYIPNRGATPATAESPPDAWVRMDPSLKRYGYAPGLRVHEGVPFALGDYLASGTALSPRRAYEDALWIYIQANAIECSTLEQLKRAGSVVEEAFPYLPGTLRGKVLSVQGEAAEVPESFRHRVRIEVRDGGGGMLLAHELPWASAYGERVELVWAGATAEDEATITAHGGLFETPPYLVDLSPVVRVAGAEVARGSAVGAAAAAEVRVTLIEASGFETVRAHETLAGERHVLAVDFGELPQAVLDRHQEALGAAVAAGDTDAVQTEELFLLGAQYLHELGRDLGDMAGWKHHRLLRLGTEALVSQTAAVEATIGGTPVSWRRAERTVDVAGMTLGLFHSEGDRSFRRETMELLGAQGSHLEGQVFPQVLERRGIAAVSALTESVRRGQAVTRVDAGNVATVLDQVDLGSDVEASVEHAVSQGRIAWVAESRITVDRWTGTGYVLEDPDTGAAGYLISGGLAGGSETGEPLDILQSLLGSEPWLEDFLIGSLMNLFFWAWGGGNGNPGTQQSDPINLSTGNFWRTETDLTIQARGLPVVWSRTYNSRSGHEGPLGHGWTFSYGETLEEQPDGSVLYREADGTEHLFRDDGAGGFTAPPGKHLALARTAGGFELRTKERLLSEFDADGRLLALEEPNGNRVTLGYDGAGHLASVTDAAGRTALTVTTGAAGRITRVEDLAGRAIVYGYSGSDLTSVTDTTGETWSYAYDAAHNLVAMSDPLGHTDTWAYDALDRCHRHVDPTGATETFSYAERGRKGVVTDRRGFDTYLEFDDRGRATLQVDPLGNAGRSTWDEGNNRTSTTDPRGGLTVREFDERGNVLAETDPLGQTTTYTYDPTFNQVATTTDPSGHTVANSYDAAGNLLETSQVVDGETITETFTYDADGLLQRRTDARGETTTFTWDATKGSLESQTDPAGHTTTMTTDALGRVAAIEDPAGNPMTVTWDGRDRLVTATDPFGNTTEITYDAAGRQTAMTTPRGTSTTDYDAAGRPIASTDPLGHVTRTEYDAAGNPLVRIDANGNRTTTTYDPVGRVAAQVDPLGAVWSFGYCAEIGGGGGCGAGGCGGAPSGGDFCELTDPLGNTTVQDFDALGRVNRITDPEGNVSTIAYDELGRQSAVTDALGRTTRYELDPLGRLTAVVEANGARTEYTYGTGNLTEILDAEGRTWTRTYDELGRLATEADPLGNTTTYRYDALGNLIEKINPDGKAVGYEYDLRRLTAVVLPGGARETFGYDPLGRRTSMANAEVSLSFVYDALSRMTSVTNHTLGQTIGYGYDALGNRTSMDGPLGRVQYLYDAKNRLTEQQDPATGFYRLEYDAADRRVGLLYPNGVATEYEYDRANRLTLLLTRDLQAEVLDGYRYTYDPTGNRTTMRSLREDVLHEYTYDAVNRLKRWQPGPNRFEAFAYDLVGNRQQLDDERGSNAYSYDDANRLIEELRILTDGSTTTKSYSWDPNGNLLAEEVEGENLTTYTWDSLNRLTALDGPTGTHVYGYDPDGIRVRETNGGNTTRLLHVKEDILATYQAGTLDTYFTHGPGIDEPWAQAQPGATAPLAYLHRDGLGSITAVSSPTAVLLGTTSYAAFGQVEESEGSPTRYGYASRDYDATSLLYYRARYYDPSMGRFSSQDPFAGDLLNPASLNRFSYVLNNPVLLTDPTGMAPSTWGVAAAMGRVILATWLLILIGAVCAIRGVERDCLAVVGTLMAGTPFWFSATIAFLFVLLAMIQIIAYYRDGDLELDWTVSFILHIAAGAATLLMIEYVIADPPTPARRFAAGFVIVSLLISVYSELPKLLEEVRKSK
jgi:RHS repeat-associated protein